MAKDKWYCLPISPMPGKKWITSYWIFSGWIVYLFLNRHRRWQTSKITSKRDHKNRIFNWESLYRMKNWETIPIEIWTTHPNVVLSLTQMYEQSLYCLKGVMCEIGLTRVVFVISYKWYWNIRSRRSILIHRYWDHLCNILLFFMSSNQMNFQLMFFLFHFSLWPSLDRVDCGCNRI